jgi:hypothetical protein
MHSIFHLTIFLFLISGGVRCDLWEDFFEEDDRYIQSRPLEYFTNKHTNPVTAKCLVNEMASYSLSADSPDLGSANPICPQLPNGNCCGPEDVKRIKRFWRHDTRHQGYYYAAFLKMNRWILGYSRQWSAIANNILSKADSWIKEGKVRRKDQPQEIDDEDEDQPYTLTYHPYCVKAANKLIHIDLVDKHKAMIFYKDMTTRFEFMQNARRGFYCMLCDANARRYIRTRKNNPFQPTIKYSRDFCEMVYNNIFPAVYQTYRSYNPFLTNLFRMLACVTPKDPAKQGNNGGAPVIPNAEPEVIPLSLRVNLKAKVPHDFLPVPLKKLYRNPLKLNSKFWLNWCYGANPRGFWFPIRCYYLCDNFHMTHASALFDGDIDSMETIFKELERYEFAMETISQNIYEDDIMVLKNQIRRSLDALGRNYLFYRSISTEVDMAKYYHDFSIFYKGINPMTLSEGSTLEFAYKGGQIMGALVALLLGIFRAV